jgi:hypothetical protein
MFENLIFENFLQCGATSCCYACDQFFRKWTIESNRIGRFESDGNCITNTGYVGIKLIHILTLTNIQFFIFKKIIKNRALT